MLATGSVATNLLNVETLLMNLVQLFSGYHTIQGLHAETDQPSSRGPELMHIIQCGFAAWRCLLSGSIAKANRFSRVISQPFQ